MTLINGSISEPWYSHLTRRVLKSTKRCRICDNFFYWGSHNLGYIWEKRNSWKKEVSGPDHLWLIIMYLECYKKSRANPTIDYAENSERTVAGVIWFDCWYIGERRFALDRVICVWTRLPLWKRCQIISANLVIWKSLKWTCPHSKKIPMLLAPIVSKPHYADTANERFPDVEAYTDVTNCWIRNQCFWILVIRTARRQLSVSSSRVSSSGKRKLWLMSGSLNRVSVPFLSHIRNGIGCYLQRLSPAQWLTRTRSRENSGLKFMGSTSFARCEKAGRRGRNRIDGPVPVKKGFSI